MAVRMRKCVMPIGPATSTKSLRAFLLVSLRFVAVLGDIMVRRSFSRSLTRAAWRPLRKTKDLGSPFLDGSLPSGRWVRFFLCGNVRGKVGVW